MSKLRIAFYGPLGYFKGWQALRKLELWARETNILIPRQLSKEKRLVNLFEQFKARMSRGQHAGLIVCRERRGLNRHKSYYRRWLDARGFPGRKKPKVATQPSPTNPYIAYQQSHPNSKPPGDFLIPPGAQVVHYSGVAPSPNFIIDSVTQASLQHAQETLSMAQQFEAMVYDLPEPPEHA